MQPVDIKLSVSDANLRLKQRQRGGGWIEKQKDKLLVYINTFLVVIFSGVWIFY